MEETLEQLRQDRDAYKQAYENMCVFYKQLVLANQRLAASHEAVEHRVQSDECPECKGCGGFNGSQGATSCEACEGTGIRR